MHQISALGLVLFAMLLGAVVGYERSLLNKPAGLKPTCWYPAQRVSSCTSGRSLWTSRHTALIPPALCMRSSQASASSPAARSSAMVPTRRGSRPQQRSSSPPHSDALSLSVRHSLPPALLPLARALASPLGHATSVLATAVQPRSATGGRKSKSFLRQTRRKESGRLRAWRPCAFRNGPASFPFRVRGPRRPTRCSSSEL